MSFILDALKKSEAERQQHSPTEFSSVPSSPTNTRSARWLWFLGVVLLVNLVVLIGLVISINKKSADNSMPAIAAGVETVATTPPANNAATTSFAEQVATAVKELPPPDATIPATQSVAQPETQRTNTAIAPATRPSSNASSVVTIDQLRLDGSLVLDELHLDIHVFSDNPSDRFVFINMDKHREGSRIDEGPVVKEITPDGVILDYQGRTFLLPRE